MSARLAFPAFDRRRSAIPLLCGASFVLLACGTGKTDPLTDDERECEVQADCPGEGHSQICVAYECSEELPENEVRNVIIELNSLAVRQAKSFRIWAVHPSRPDGGTVTCDELKSLGNATEVLLGGETYNVTSPPSSQSRSGSGDISKTGLQINGAPRLIYVAAYPNPLGAPGAEGTAIAGECTPLTSFVPGAGPDPAIVVKLK